MTMKNQINAGLACRRLSEKADQFLHSTSPLDVYEYETEEGTRYAYNGCIGTKEDMTFEELEEEFELEWEATFAMWFKDLGGYHFTDENEWWYIVEMMDDEIRETVHREIAPCTNEEFITRYVEIDPDFLEVLEREFGIVQR